MATLRLKYNPSHMPEDELVRSFVVRQRDLAAILETVTENTGASNQHLLILGPRGMGKTTLVNRAVAEIRRDPALGQLWYPILFDEESYTVTSAGELWFQALVHLADQTRSPTLEQARRALQPITDRTRLRDASLARLLEFADSQHKRLLLVFENIDMIFDAQMTEADGWDVRHTLQNEPRIMVLATSPTRLESFHDSRKPLYELFHEHTLERLDLEECRAVWRLVADRDLPLHQARPIQIFTGGNTRLLTILATFARDRSFRELMDDLVGLIDENTSYFKANIEALPPESRKVFVTLADLWSPATSRQVADQTRGDIRAVSAQLGRLVDQGIIEVVRRVDRTQMFQVAERMYNLYYLLRRRGSGRVRALVEFIVRYYDHDERQRLLITLANETCQLDPAHHQEHIEILTGVLERVPDLIQRHQALMSLPAELLAVPDIARLLLTTIAASFAAPVATEDQLRARLNVAPNDLQSLVELSTSIARRGLPEHAAALAERALTIDPTSFPALTAWMMTLFPGTHLSPPARIAAIRRALTIAAGEASAAAQLLLAKALVDAGLTDEARTLANDALERWPDNTGVAALLGGVFAALGDLQAAREALTHALELDPANDGAAVMFCALVIDQGPRDAAEAHLRRGLDLQPRAAPLWLALVDLLANTRGDVGAALHELQRAEQFHPHNLQLIHRRGELLIRQDRHAEAELVLRRAAFELGSDAALLDLIVAMRAQDKLGEARVLLQTRLGPNPSPERLLALASLDFTEHKVEAGLDSLRRIVASPQASSDVLLGAMAWYVHISDLAGARAAAQAGLARAGELRPLQLQRLCRFVLESSFAPLYPDVLDWARQLAKTPPYPPLANLFIARVEARADDGWTRIWEPLGVTLDHPEIAAVNLRDIIALLALAAAHGHAARALHVLALSPSAPHFEPLLVALRRLADQPTNPPQEVSEVADDIVRDIERLRHALATSPAPALPNLSPKTHQQHRKTPKRGRATTDR